MSKEGTIEVGQRKTGFLKTDVARFLAQGRGLSGATAGAGVSAPQRVTATRGFRITEKRSLFGGSQKTAEDITSGPAFEQITGGEVSPGRISALAEAFTSRQQQILQRRRQPGQRRLTFLTA